MALSQPIIYIQLASMPFTEVCQHFWSGCADSFEISPKLKYSATVKCSCVQDLMQKYQRPMNHINFSQKTDIGILFVNKKVIFVYNSVHRKRRIKTSYSVYHKTGIVCCCSFKFCLSGLISRVVHESPCSQKKWKLVSTAKARFYMPVWSDVQTCI